MKRRSTSASVLCVMSVCLLSTATTWAASPRLTLILPRGIQRGTEQVITLSGSNLGDAQEILFYDPGFEVTKIEGKGNSVTATVKIAADCRLGEHVVQVRCASGISDYRTIFIEALPAVAEKEPNSEFAVPQPIALNVTVGGVVTNEDVDYYVVDAKKGQRISAEVVAMRLGTFLFDPYVAILDSKRFELSSGDDTPLVLQDSVASIIAPADGKYTIEVRESAYAGNGNCRYRLHVGTFPRPTAVYPAGGKLGEEVEVRFLGGPGGELKQKVKLPAEPNAEYGVFASDAGGISPTPNPFRLFEHGNAFEAEPNNELAQATTVALPLAFNGIIETKGDVDHFKFGAKKGQVFEVECYARRVRSALDPVMSLYKAAGGRVASNDDSRGPDSYFRFSVPADGEYVVSVTDHLGRGGSDFVYRVEFQTVTPRLALSIPRNERYGQYRQQIYVARGNRFATLINATRSNFGGELALTSKDLPAGVTMHAQNMPANMNSMPVVFEAAADAPVAGKLVDFTAQLVDPMKKVSGGFTNSSDFIVGAPGQSVYKRKSVNRLAIAVVDELPFTLELVQPKVPIVQNGSMQLKVVVHRKEGFKGAINVQLPFRPPGISGASSVNIPADKTEVLYPIGANGGAQIKIWPIYVLGTSNVSGAAWVASQLATLEIAAPLVTFTAQRASCEQGEEAQILCKVNLVKEFPGNAKLKLVGLPNKVTAEDIEFNKDTKELVFIVKTDPTCNPAKLNSLFCQATIIQNGEPIVSRAGAVRLQIDKPLPPEPNQPAVKPQPKPTVVAKTPTPEKPKPKAKPLTRLQKLRLAAKQRAEAKAQLAGGQ